jgi:hypothetical protein
MNSDFFSFIAIFKPFCKLLHRLFAINFGIVIP